MPSPSVHLFSESFSSARVDPAPSASRASKGPTAGGRSARSPGVRAVALGVGLALMGATAASRAQMAADGASAPLAGVVHLQGHAVIERPRDLMTVVLSTTREGSEPAAVQSALKQALDTALAEARRAVRPGQVEVQTGVFSLQPRYAPKGGISGWVGSAELQIEGRDMAAIGQLVGRIQTLTVARVNYSLSREARQAVESEATAQAVERFRARASEIARLFGYTGYALGEVHVSNAEPAAPEMPQRMRMAASTMAGDGAPLPTEAGKGLVSVVVNGQVRLTR